MMVSSTADILSRKGDAGQNARGSQCLPTVIALAPVARHLQRGTRDDQASSRQQHADMGGCTVAQ
eukprot:8735875-Alexandrium_andersonii.AAC.1